MIRSFVFSQNKLVGQDLGMDFLKMVLFDEDAQVWMDLENPTPEEAKNTLEGVFNFHPLAIEDCVNVTERPKVDDYDTYIFLVIHAVDFSHDKQEFQTTELNLFIGKNFIVTYHEKPLRSVTATIDRILKNPVAAARAPDRLTYTLLDLLFANYDPAIDQLSLEIAHLESNVLTASSSDVLSQVLNLKAEVQRLRQIVAPQREVIARLARGEVKLVRAHMLPYYRDLLDRLARISDAAENYREALTNTLQVHLNLQQMEVNRVIKVLTVLATLALPFVAVTSFYGMNFKYMPELEWLHPYAFVYGVTAACTGVIYWILKKKKWL